MQQSSDVVTRPCKLTPYVEPLRSELCNNPQLLKVGDTLDLGSADLANHVVVAVSNYQQIRITLSEGTDEKPPTAVKFMIEKVTPGYGFNLLNLSVRLFGSSSVQLANLVNSQAVISVDTLTGETKLFCEEVGVGYVERVTRHSSEDTAIPDYQVAHVRFKDKLHRWTTDSCQEGQAVSVRVTAHGILIVR
ncbi:MAG TPA: hypothetical protein VFZ48_03400 [Candidatus Saccharimonadales bacterium]